MFKRRKRICLFLVSMLITIFALSGCRTAEGSDNEPEKAQQGEIGNLNVFRAYSNVNESYTHENLDDFDVTVVCFWAPWSEASLYELKRFDNLVKRFPDKIGFITVALDGDEKKITSALKTAEMTDYTTLVSGDGDFKVVCDQIENVPTTIFVDHEGTKIGSTIIGIQDDFEKTYLAQINKALKSIGKKKISLETSDEVEE